MIGQDSCSLKKRRSNFDNRETITKYGYNNNDKSILTASFNVAYEIAKRKKPHTIGENLIKPCLLKNVYIMLGSEVAERFEKIPMSNNVVPNKIYVMNQDMLDQLLHDIKNSTIKTYATASNIFNTVKKFFLYNNLNINIIGSICTDGVLAMSGINMDLLHYRK